MQEKSIVELIEERLDHGSIELPVFHPVAMEIQHLLSKGDYNYSDITKIIRKDQALVSRVLKVANSAFYTGLKAVTTIQDALVRLGSKSISNLVIMATQRQMYRSKNKEITRRMNPLWSHALGAAVASHWLAGRLGLNKLVEESFLAGLLHDIGKLFLLKAIENLQESGSVEKSIPWSIIDDVLETMHPSQGERLMRHQNMPEVYCYVVGKHHEEKITGENGVMNIARLANLTCHKVGIGSKRDPGLMLSTTPEAINLMANDLLLAEMKVNLEEKKLSMEELLESNKSSY